MNQVLERKRIIIFIDHANLFQNIEDLNIRINYLPLRDIFINKHHLIRLFIYMGDS